MPNRFQLGVTYYPEHWPVENHARDLDRIAAAGFNVVRLGEGAWWYWEPREGHYQFELFDRVIELCRTRGIKVIMGTPTYTGPAWIGHDYPETLRVNFERQPLGHGSRQNFNHTSPKFLDLSRRICTALAEHYKDEPQIIAWQLDNEINNGSDASYSDADVIAFRAWLRTKYATLAALNEAWGTRFWSQVYSDWEQIQLPGPTAQGQNPHRLLDQSRFISDSVVSFLKEQADILKRANPRWQVTHNAPFGNTNTPKLMDELDFFSHDHYPLFWNHWSEFSQKLIDARALSFPFSILEQQAGPGGQMSYLLRTPEPGEMRLWTYESIAHGADRVLYFTWRTAAFGTEQHWHGLIDQDGKDTRRLHEAAHVAKELATLPEEFFDAPPVKVAAVLRDFDVDVNEKRINTYTHDGRWAFGRWAASLIKRHVPTDFVWSDGDFDGYSLLIASHLKIVDEAIVEKLTRFVERGGTLVLGAQSGLHDRQLHIRQQTPPGPLAALAGVEVEDWTTLAKDVKRQLSFTDGPSVDAFAFAERLKPTTACTLARWHGGGFLDGGVAATMNCIGEGKVIYLGGYLDAAATSAIVEWLCGMEEIESPIEAGDAIECVIRQGEGTRYLALLNHAAEATNISRLPTNAVALIGPTSSAGSLQLPPYGVSLLKTSSRG